MIKMRAKIITVGLLGAAAIVPVDLAQADQLGHASWYSLPANKTANGEQMNPNELTAAHRSLPFGTRVLVENLSNGQSVVVRINDRGPFIGGRIIDLSKAAAASIGMIGAGTAKVRVTTAGGAVPADGGVLADLGESTAKETAKENDGASFAAAVKAAIAQPKPAGEEVKAAGAPRSKPPAKVAKAAPKSPKAKSVVAASSKKRDGARMTVKVAEAATRSKARGRANARVKALASANGIRAAGFQASKFSSRRATVASNGIRAAGLQASKFSSRRINVAANTPHPYAILGTTPGFIKPVRTRERRAAG